VPTQCNNMSWYEGEENDVNILKIVMTSVVFHVHITIIINTMSCI